VTSEKRSNPPFAGFAEFRIVGGKREAHWTGKVALVYEKLMEPLSWRKKARKFAEKHGRKPRAFISMSDLFHEEMQDSMIDRVFAVMALTPEISYMILTKRADRMADYLSRGNDSSERVDQCAWGMIDDHGGDNLGAEDFREIEFPLPNIAIGVSVESQKYADERIPHLLRTPAAMRFVSQEPQLEEIEYLLDLLKQLDMVIVGGESGPGARPFDIAWARQTVKQCREARVAPFVKQLGADPAFLIKAKVRNRKGEDMAEWPEDLRVREWPEGWN
jgi:protein gp37